MYISYCSNKKITMIVNLLAKYTVLHIIQYYYTLNKTSYNHKKETQHSYPIWNAIEDTEMVLPSAMFELGF